jgi:hypothetical protein
MSDRIIDAPERWSVVDRSHLRRLVAGASGRLQIVEPLDLLRTQLEAVGSCVLLDARDSSLTSTPTATIVAQRAL